jgi:hypothetical protein
MIIERSGWQKAFKKLHENIKKSEKNNFNLKIYGLTLDKANHLDQIAHQQQHQLHGSAPLSQGHHVPCHFHQPLLHHQRHQQVEHFHSGCTHQEMQNLHLYNYCNNIISTVICTTIIGK